MKLETEEIEELVRRIVDIVESKFEYNYVNNGFEEKFENLVYDLNNLIRESEELVEDFKANELTFNTIEAEGFCRGMISVKNILERYASEN